MNKFCTNCGKPLDPDSSFCTTCGAAIGDTSSQGGVVLPPSPRLPDRQQQVAFMPGAAEGMNEMVLMRDMTDNQRIFFQGEMNKVRKIPSTAFWLAFWLGGVGAQHFYLGNTGRGVLYLLFSWTGIPVLISLFELFSIKWKVDQLNYQFAVQKAVQVKTFLAA